MKISTKSGDKGESGLFNGKRLKKNGPIFAALGDLDELNSVLGWCKFGSAVQKEMDVIIHKAQDDIYKMMSILGFEMKVPEKIEAINENDIHLLEAEIEKLEEIVGDLRKFIRPGSTEEASRIHIARSVCRRAERTWVGCDFTGATYETCLRYLNRLSDLLFLLAYRYEDKTAPSL